MCLPLLSRRIRAIENEAAQLRTDKELLEKKLSRAEEAHKAEIAKLTAVCIACDCYS